jgi:short-subunit dehydrogenase
MNVLLLGNSDGIGLRLTIDLLSKGHNVVGISKSVPKVNFAEYKNLSQHLLDVRSPDFKEALINIVCSIENLDLCVICIGIGEELNFSQLQSETTVFEVNLMSAVVVTEVVINKMMKDGRGHFIGLSSIADAFPDAGAPSYNASKAGVSYYWEGLGLALLAQKSKVKISNIRFGFVDTKMAKSPIKPFMISPEEASKFILEIVDKPRLRASKPLIMACVVKIVSLFVNLKIRLS